MIAALEQFVEGSWRPAPADALPLRFGETKYFRLVYSHEGARRMKRNAKDAQEPALYPLGPQPDGAVIIKLPNDHFLMVLRKAVEKQEKNATAAGGTLSALAEGDDPWLDQVTRTLGKLKSLLANARAPENQIADTPIGKEITAAAKAALEGKELERIDGRDGDLWAPHVPGPRPMLGDMVAWPDGATDIISGIDGWAEDAEAFIVQKGNGTALVVAHESSPGVLVWRVKGALYGDATVSPSVAKDLPADTAAPTTVEAVEYEIVDDAPSSAANDAEPSAPEKKKRGRPVGSKSTVTTSAAQRERNTRHAGMSKPATVKGKKGR